jgi:plasmid stabilization system protein ParE
MAHRLAPEAEAELDEIWYYIAAESNSIQIADRLIDSITDRFCLLARHPQVGRRRDKDLRPGLRSFPAGEYVIIYSVDDAQEVLILHVIRGSRDIEALLRR